MGIYITNGPPIFSTNSKIDLVISYYKEDLDWLQNYAHIPFRHIYIYNKGPGTPNTTIPHTEIRLPNIGRCDHTYLYHIVTKYDTLAPVTVFTTGSSDLPHKKDQLAFTVTKAAETNNSVFHGYRFNHVANELYNFRLDEWQATHSNNKGGVDELHPAMIQPFGRWYESLFPGVKATFATFGGVFAVSMEHVHQHTIDYYQRLLEEFPNHSNPEVGHYFERAWIAVFDPVPANCLYEKESAKSILPTLFYFFIAVCILCTILYIYIVNPTYITRMVSTVSFALPRK